MSMKLTNIRERTCGFCAFCKYWYDPAAFRHRAGRRLQRLLRFDMSKEALCMKTVRTKKKSWQSYSKYECKIPY